MSEAPYGIPVTCEDCKHLNHEVPVRCAAFPDGIPVWIRYVDDSHLQPVNGDHGIRFEPSDEFLKMVEEEGFTADDFLPTEEEMREIEEAARITPEDIEYAHKLAAERSPFLAELLEAEPMYEEEVIETSDSDHEPRKPEVEPKIVRMTLDVTFDFIFRVEGDPRPCLRYSLYAERPDGKVKWLNSSVEVHDPENLLRLETEFKFGDQIRLTLDVSCDLDPDVLIGFEKISDLSDADHTTRA